MNFVVISDTHGLHEQLAIPTADILIHAGDGDLSTIDDLQAFLKWLSIQPHAYKILIAGNHDWIFQEDARQAEMLCKSYNVIYLRDSGVDIDGTKFWGSPFTPTFFNWAFMEDRGKDIAKHWDLIPDGTQILITHGPPMGILDQTGRGDHAGCEELINHVKRIRPKYHVFGHIHESRGWYEENGTIFINACSLDQVYLPWQKEIEIWEI